MRLHFAAEIVLELAYQNLDSIEKIGAHIAQDKARIDFKWDENISTVLPLIKKEALGIIEANREIISAFSDEEKEERYWEIRGFSRASLRRDSLKEDGRGWRDRVEAQKSGQKEKKELKFM